MSDAKYTKSLNPSILTTSELNKGKQGARVDINHLIARVRKQKSDENKTAVVFFLMFAALFSAIVIILMF